MAHGLNNKPIIKREIIECNNNNKNKTLSIESSVVNSNKIITATTKMGSRRIFTPQFKLQVLDSYRNDADCKGNQRATARKYGIHRRQIQKWLQCEGNLRSSVINNGNRNCNNKITSSPLLLVQPNLSLDLTRQSVASNNTTISTNTSTTTTTPTTNTINPTTTYTTYNTLTTATSSTSTAGFISPVLSYTSEPLSISFTHESSASLPNSPVSYTTTIGRDFDGLISCSSGGDYIKYEQNYPIVHYDYNNEYYNENNEIIPIDLSLQNKSINTFINIDQEKLLTRATSSPSLISSSSSSSSTIVTLQKPKNDVNKLSFKNMEAWDLSCRKRKYHHDENNWQKGDNKNDLNDNDENDTPKPAKVVKLFKPYLLEDNNYEKKIKNESHGNEPIIWSNHPCSPCYDNNNNNNNNIYTNDLYPSPTYPSYTTASSTTYEIPYWCPQGSGSPVSGYDSSVSSVCSNYSNFSDISEPIHHYNIHLQHQYNNHQINNHHYNFDQNYEYHYNNKQRQSYSIDFKLQTIDSYYHDINCQGNQVAVATKYNIHRRQVQKWLQQEEDLRQRIVIMN